MRRRDFITLLGGAAAWPLAARAQRGDRLRRIGVLLTGDENNLFSKPGLSLFTQALAGLGWTGGRNVWMDFRYAGDDINRIRALAHEGCERRVDLTNTVGVENLYLQPERVCGFRDLSQHGFRIGRIGRIDQQRDPSGLGHELM